MIDCALSAACKGIALQKPEHWHQTRVQPSFQLHITHIVHMQLVQKDWKYKIYIRGPKFNLADKVKGERPD
jgi:hypothetical protein